jgi:hypothetical protein
MTKKMDKAMAMKASTALAGQKSGRRTSDQAEGELPEELSHGVAGT